MASSENQGLQIALIIFVMLTILLSVTTFMFFREYEEADQKSRKDVEGATKAAQQLREAVTEMESLRKMIGVSDQAKLTDVRTSFDEDMKKFATTVPDESKFYRPALEFLANTLNEKTTELIAARDTIQQEKDEREKVEQAKQVQVAAAEENARKAEADKEAAKKEFDAERKKMLEDMADLQRQSKDKNDKMTELAETSKKKQDELTAEKAKLERANTYLNEKNVALDPTSGFEVPDGRIVWVDQRSRSAYINVGQADGLRRQTLFSVVAGDDDVGNDQKTKGRLEVTEILGPHFAQARIIEDKLIDPMVEGDQIFTPLWQPGRAEGIGIIGFIDIDGDGVDDREMVRDLVKLNGARIDAEDSPDGKQVGELNINTRYLVLGEPPQGKDVLDKAYTKLQRDATRMGVRLISVGKFLDQVGWKNQKQTLRFGRRGNAEDVPATQPDGGRQQATGSVSGAFKVRRPYGSRGLGGIPSESKVPQQQKKKSAYSK
jgi:hypothetical protein